MTRKIPQRSQIFCEGVETAEMDTSSLVHLAEIRGSLGFESELAQRCDKIKTSVEH